MVGDTAKSNPFPVDLDKSWKISWLNKQLKEQTVWPVKNWLRDTSEKGTGTFATARREFKSVKEMNDDFRFKKSHHWSQIKATNSLEKKFRWFYTYYTYKEVYPRIKSFDKIPFDKYMTKEEVEFWFTGKPDLLKGMNGLEIREFVGGIENKYNIWLAHNIWDVEYEEFLKKYDSLEDKPVSAGRLALVRDSIFNKYYKSADSEKQDLNMEVSLNKYFNTTKFSPLWATNTSPMKKFEQNSYNLEFLDLFGEAFNYKLIMPGKIINPGNAIMHGDTLIWKLDTYRMVPENYEFVAKSRKANTWVFILSALILVLVVSSYFYSPKKYFKNSFGKS
jgi:hypothetical protein